MEAQKTFEIFTDTSFDDLAKVGTYAIVIIQKNKIVKIIAKKCNVQLENSTECEIFAIFQAINLIQGSLLQEFNSKQYKVIAYLFRNSDEQKLILKTQSEIAEKLELSTYSINKIFKEFIKLNILGKIKNGKYILLI